MNVIKSPGRLRQGNFSELAETAALCIIFIFFTAIVLGLF